MPEFHETGYGRRFFDAQLPQLTKNIGRLANAIELLVRVEAEDLKKEQSTEKEEV